jgi:hypothetical protein
VFIAVSGTVFSMDSWFEAGLTANLGKPFNKQDAHDLLFNLQRKELRRNPRVQALFPKSTASSASVSLKHRSKSSLRVPVAKGAPHTPTQRKRSPVTANSPPPSYLVAGGAADTPGQNLRVSVNYATASPNTPAAKSPASLPIEAKRRFSGSSSD